MDTPEVVIRQGFRVGDIGQIVLFHAMYYAALYGWNVEFEAYVAKPLAEFALRKDPRESIWLVESSGRVRGAIALVSVDETTAQLRWYYLEEDLRGRGIGTLLMERFMDFAVRCGYSSIILWTTTTQTAAIRLYEARGFRLRETETHEVWGGLVTELKYGLELLP